MTSVDFRHMDVTVLYGGTQLSERFHCEAALRSRSASSKRVPR